MHRLNLDIQSYTESDLIRLFSLKNNFDTTHIHTGKDKLMNQLKKAKEMTSEQKQNIQMFIDNATTVLIDASDKSNNRSDVQGTWAQKKNNMVTSGGDHFIIANANTEAGKTADIAGGRIAGSSEVPPGWLNTINIRTVATCMNIDTRFRNLYQTTTSSDFQFDLPDIQKKVTIMKITNIDIPMSFYGVMRSRNDSTVVITEATKRSSLTMRTNAFNDYPMSDTNTNTNNTDSSYNTQTGQWSQEFVQSILKLHPCFSHIEYEPDIPTIYSLIDTTDSNKMMVYQTYGAGSEWQSAKFFKNPVLINTLYYPTDSKDTLNGKAVQRDYYMVSAYNEDTNSDGYINTDDLRRFFLFNLDGTMNMQLIPDGYSVNSSQYDPYNDYMYVYAAVDENVNGYQDDIEDVHVFWIDLKSPQKGARLY